MGHSVPIVARTLRPPNRRAALPAAVGWLIVWVSSGCAPTPTAEVPPWLAAQVHIEPNQDGRTHHPHVNMQMSGAAPDGLVSLPIVWREGRICLGDVSVADATQAGTRRKATPVLDTGAASAVGLSRAGAARYRPWLSAVVGRTESIGAFGAYASQSGVLGGLNLGAISIGPVPVSVGKESAPLRLGMGLLSAFEGIIFDWQRQRLHLVVRRRLLTSDALGSRERLESLAQRPEWSPAALRIGTQAEELKEVRQIVLSTTDPWLCAEIQVAGRSYVALIDTGSTGDLLLRNGIDWPLGPAARRNATDVAGARRRVEERLLRTPLMLGSLRYEGITVTTGWDAPWTDDPPFDAIIGLSVLRRAPMWLDWESGVMRIWTGAAPLPDLGGESSR